MATNGVEPAIAAGESQVCSGGKRLISNGPFIESHYHAGEPDLHIGALN